MPTHFNRDKAMKIEGKNTGRNISLPSLRRLDRRYISPEREKLSKKATIGLSSSLKKPQCKNFEGFQQSDVFIVKKVRRSQILTEQ